MSKTKEELNEIKKDCESLNTKLNELSEDELKEVTGGLLASADFKSDFSKVISLNQNSPKIEDE